MKRKASTLLGALLHSEIARPYATYDSRNSYPIYVEPSVSLGLAKISSASLPGWPAPHRHGLNEPGTRWNR